MSMHISVVAQSKPTAGISFFHPRAFETAISELMTYYFGEDLSRGGSEQDWFIPTEWHPLTRFSCIATRFDAIQNAKLGLFDRRRYCYLPLTDEHLLEIVFPIERHPVYLNLENQPEADVNQWVSEAPMIELADQILDSLEVKLSDKAKQQQEKALEGLNAQERKLTDHFAPLKWTTG